MRALVGPTDPEAFDNPTGKPVFEGLSDGQNASVLDFGCGCGRVARQLIQQRPRPQRYLGLDLHAGMVQWCSDNLAPHAPGFEFRHHDVFYAGFNPTGSQELHAPIPAGDGEFTLEVAISVFTHLTEVQTVAYLAELARVMAPDGVLISTWFLFDKREFPMMQENQNTLFINEHDVRNAVIYDRDWLRRAAAEAGLAIVQATPPSVRGYHWHLRMARADSGVDEVELPDDFALPGRQPPPPLPADASEIGARPPDR